LSFASSTPGKTARTDDPTMEATMAGPEDESSPEKLREAAEETGAEPGADEPGVPPDSTGYSAPPLDAPDTP
jgi:hypothetical protein